MNITPVLSILKYLQKKKALKQKLDFAIFLLYKTVVISISIAFHGHITSENQLKMRELRKKVNYVQKIYLPY